MDLVESAVNRGGIGNRHPWELARIEVIVRVLRDMAALHAGDIVVDLGCGDGFLSEQLARRYPGVSFYGVDPALDEQLLGALTRGLTVSNLRLFRTLDEAATDIPGKKATVILLMDVIEHIQDDVAFLKALQDSPLTGPSTRYIISAPAFGLLFCAHDVVLGHYRRYSNSALRRLIQRAGLEPELVCYFFSSLLLPRLVQAAQERTFRIQPRRTTQAGDWQGGRVWQSLIKNILRCDFLLSWALHRRGITVPGLSNLAICRRPA